MNRQTMIYVDNGQTQYGKSREARGNKMKR